MKNFAFLFFINSICFSASAVAMNLDRCNWMSVKPRPSAEKFEVIEPIRFSLAVARDEKWADYNGQVHIFFSQLVSEGMNFRNYVRLNNEKKIGSLIAVGKVSNQGVLVISYDILIQEKNGVVSLGDIVPGGKMLKGVCYYR
jgi:hypothetical protein